MTRRYRVGCLLDYRVEAPTVFIFNVEVARNALHRDLQETLRLSPNLPMERFAHPLNGTRYIRVLAEPGPFCLDYEAYVTLDGVEMDPAAIPETPIAELPLEVFPFLLPSRFVSSDRLAAFALAEFEHLDRGHERVTAICNWIYENIEYRRGSSNGTTTAHETLLARAGVCRDFAHLGVAFCRALGIPARFVSAYAFGLNPPDFHAVFEAWLDGRWWLFDPTRQADLNGLVRIGIGPDAAEVAFNSPYGEMEPTGMDVFIECRDADETDPRTVDAVSTAPIAA